MAGDAVRLIVDKRSLRSFTKNVDALINVVPNDMKNSAIEFAEEVLATSNALIPVDTGTAATAAGYKIENAYLGMRIRVGYTVNSDPINPRSGEAASAYITTLHEDLMTPHSNGQAKFFERAVQQHTESFASKGRERLAARLSGAEVSTGNSEAIKHTDYLTPALSRVSSGYTATHNNGRYLPYPGRS